MRHAKWSSVAVALVAVASLWITNASRGGARVDYPVWVSLDLQSASGSLGSARNSGDSTALIGCGLWAQRSYPGQQVYCNAQDAAGRFLFCSSADPRVITSYYAIKSDSRIQFRVGSDGSCVSLTVWNGSLSNVKLP